MSRRTFNANYGCEHARYIDISRYTSSGGVRQSFSPAGFPPGAQRSWHRTGEPWTAPGWTAPSGCEHENPNLFGGLTNLPHCRSGWVFERPPEPRTIAGTLPTSWGTWTFLLPARVRFRTSASWVASTGAGCSWRRPGDSVASHLEHCWRSRRRGLDAATAGRSLEHLDLYWHHSPTRRSRTGWTRSGVAFVQLDACQFLTRTCGCSRTRCSFTFPPGWCFSCSRL